MSKEKIASVHVDENGNVYELKKSVWKKPLFWSTVALGMLSVFFVWVIFVLGEYNNDIENALAEYNVSYDVKTKQIQAVSKATSSVDDDAEAQVFDFGKKAEFEQGTILIKGATISEGKVTFAIVIENNTERTSTFNPNDFVAKAGNERLNYSGLTSFIGPETIGTEYGVSANSNAVFFLNYDLPKNGSNEYSIKLGQYLWK